MRFELPTENWMKLFPAGERRLELAEARLGREGDDPALPKRFVPFDVAGRRRALFLGPVEPGGPEEKLWYLDVTVG